MFMERVDHNEHRTAQHARRMAWAREVGALLKEQREFKLMAQTALVEATAIDQGTISLFERGHVDLPFGKVKALLNAVGLDLVITDL